MADTIVCTFLITSRPPSLIAPGGSVDRHLLGEHVGQLQQEPGFEHSVRVYLSLDLLVLGMRLLHAVLGVQLGIAPAVDVVKHLHGHADVGHTGAQLVNLLQVLDNLLELLSETWLALRLKI